MDYDTRIKEGQVLLQSTDREQNERGKKILEDVISEVAGGVLSREVRAILEQAQQHQQRPRRPDPILKELADQWRGMHYLLDGRLVPYLKKLKQQGPKGIAYMRRDVVGDLPKWIQDVLPTISSDMNPDHLKRLRRFVGVMNDFDDYVLALDEFKPLRVALFDARFDEVRQQVVEALDRWETEPAFQLLEELRPSPASREDAVRQLEERIIDTEKRAIELQELFDEKPKSPPQEWLEVQLLVESALELQAFRRKHSHNIPEDRLAALQEALHDSEQAGKAFLEQKARAATDLDGMRTFWKEYQGLQIAETDLDFGYEPGWFEPTLNTYLDAKSSLVMLAGAPDDLEKIAADLQAEKRGLPSFAETKLDTYVDEIHQKTSTWTAMVAGKPFADPEAHQAPVPLALQDRVPVFLKHVRKIEDAFKAIEQEDSLALGQETYVRAIEVAQEVLAEHPDHAEALRLKEEAERGIQDLHLDLALLHWDVETFVERAPASAEPTYVELGAQKDLLERFAGLVRKDPFTSWQEADQWWTQWDALSNAAPRTVPDAFFMAVKNQQEVRRDETHTVLEGALRQPLLPQQCDEILTAFREGFSRTLINLNPFKSRFESKRQIRLVEQFIREQNWDAARKALQPLNEDQKQTRRLKTMLDIEQARTQDVGIFADVLRRRWHDVEKYYPDAGALLLEALAAAWNQSHYQALENLAHPLNRIRRKKAQPAKGALQQWQEWLTVEEALSDDISTHDVKRLIAYTDRYQNSTRRKHLGRLVERWQEQGESLMLAWAYEAFDREDSALLTSADNQAIADMVRASENVGADIDEALRTRDDLQLADLHTLKGQLDGEEDRWGKLNLYLQMLSHVPEPSKPPQVLKNRGDTIDDLVEVWGKLDAMYETDLRTKNEEIRRIERQIFNDFKDIAVQVTLLERAKRLFPFMEFNFYKKQMMDQAERCGNLDHRFINQHPEQFAQLHKRIHDVIEIFDAAIMRGGTMWTMISKEYAKSIGKAAKILIPLNEADLEALARQILELEEEEQMFQEEIRYLKDNQPVVQTGIDPSLHEVYLSHFPRTVPRSRRVYEIFQGFARPDTMTTIITQSHEAGLLPDWVRASLNNEEPQA